MTISKKLVAFLFVFVFIFLFGCNEEQEQVDTYDNKVFDISMNGDNSLTAKLSKVNYEYHLIIEGNGKSVDFDKVTSVPWNPVIKKITKVEINYGITSIGDYMFYGLPFEYYVLPSSVTNIAEKAFKNDVVIYAYGNIEGQHSNVYLYSETSPTSVGKYFHVVDGNYVIWNSYNVLFIGNSFTYFPSNATDPTVPALFKKIVESFGISVNVDYVVEGSMRLSYVLDSSRGVGEKFNELVNEKEYDFIILQEQSTLPIQDYNSFKNSVTRLNNIFKEKQPKAKVFLYETWASPTAIESSKYKTMDEMEDALNNAYTTLGEELKLSVNYVGYAFRLVNNNTELNIYYGDNRHQNKLGAYLSALVHAGSIFKLSVKSVNIDADISSNEKALLNKYAEETITGHSVDITPLDDVTPQNASVVIAWYSKESTSGLNQTIIDNWKTKLKAYLKTKNYSDDEINKIYIKGYGGNVADSCALIKSDGYVDLMVGWKSNVDTNGNLNYLEAYPGNDSTDAGLTMGTVDGRWIHLLSENPLALDIYNWLKQDGINSLKAN